MPGGGDWSSLFKSSPGLRALAIPSCFLPPLNPVRYSEGSSRESPLREQGIFSSLLTTIKLRTLLIKCYLRTCLRDFSVIAKLAHLEELTVSNIDASVSMIRLLANNNVRTVRLSFIKYFDLSEFEPFIRASVKLKRFRLEANSFRVFSNTLWRALAQSESLEQVCLETRSLYGPTHAIKEYLSQMLRRINIIHMHVDDRMSRIYLEREIRFALRDFVVRHPHREVYVRSESSSFHMREYPPVFLPGRSLCCVPSYIAKVKPVGCNLP